MRRVLFVVTSLMGAGHLQRTLILARAVNAAGGRALVVHGGRAFEQLARGGVEMRALPPVWSDGVDYSRLLTPEGEADEAWMEARRRRLLEVFEEFRPDELVTELFPFGRRNLSAEFLALLAQAKGRARLHASIRDVLEPKRKPKRWAETAARLRDCYDGVLVHGDGALIPLARTWPPADEHADLIRYTGYVAEPPPPPDPTSRGEVLVAVGGGVIGRRLLDAAAEAAAGGSRPWRLRIGGADAAVHANHMRRRFRDAPAVFEPAAADYRARLGAAACSVSLLGYNMATDLLSVSTPAVISPMQDGGEQEQVIRAEAFRQLPGFFLAEAEPASLTRAVDKAIAAGPRERAPLALDGAARTAALLLA